QQRAQSRPAPTASSAPTATVTASTTLPSKTASSSASSARTLAPTIGRSTSRATASTSKQALPPIEKLQIAEKLSETDVPREDPPTMRSRPRREAQQGLQSLRSRSATVPKSDAPPAAR